MATDLLHPETVPEVMDMPHVSVSIEADPAAQTRRLLSEAGVSMVRLVGPPGAGKTALIDATARHLKGRCRIGVIVANPAAERDAEPLKAWCRNVQTITCSVPMPRDVLEAVQHMRLNEVDLIILEACGGIAAFPDVGENATVAVLSTSGGDDKAAEYGNLIRVASVVLLTKTDLQQYVAFDPMVFRGDVQQLHPGVELIELSITRDSGITQWFAWLARHSECSKPAPKQEKVEAGAFFG